MDDALNRFAKTQLNYCSKSIIIHKQVVSLQDVDWIMF